ncbi:hypothetical protein BC834DRAFT_937493 [Gloeopeniophorella convolvens]|nr:hypothetical protein BC834DRAFT_937493 [Gloeopeniophorella convolvens]
MDMNIKPTRDTMLSCPAVHCPLPTWNRTFPSAEALIEHARQYRPVHPICTVCFRVFKDSAALDQHAEAKHVVLCQPCKRRYKSQGALDQHWRASSAHPNCTLCEAGAADAAALVEHITNAHPKVRCCGALLYESDLDKHYLASRAHPTCDRCSVGFATEAEYNEHNSALHSELQCGICSAQFLSEEALKAHEKDSSSHRRCEFCPAQFKDTSALVEHFTITHLPRDDAQATLRHSGTCQSTPPTARSPSPPMTRTYRPSGSRPSSIVVGAERATPGRPPLSRASTSMGTTVSDDPSELYYTPPSLTSFTPSTSRSGSSSATSRVPLQSYARPSQQSIPTAYSEVHRRSPAVVTPPFIVSPSPPSSPSPPPSPPPQPAPVTPARKAALMPPQPSSARSKVSVAETPSGDLANFHLLKGSPLQSVVDFDTPTPSPRTPSVSSVPSVSPADGPTFAYAPAHAVAYVPVAAERRFLPAPGVSPSVARAQRAAAAAAIAVRSPFHCRVCRADPCREITATACGHVFCNACIVEEVRENARCPVCNAAVLLFALLRLDVS